VTTLTAPTGGVSFGPGLPVVLINDQLRIMDQAPEVLARLRESEIDPLVTLAHRGQELGTDMVDILINHPELDEVKLLPRIATAVHEAVGCPISLDSRNQRALRAALAALRPYKAMINSVTAEAESLEGLLPIASEYGAALVGMPIGDRYGLPKDAAGRISEARVIIERAADYGIPKDDIVIDAICLASSAEPGSMNVTLETLRRLHEELDVATTLGIGNAGHGMPWKTHIDLAYLIAAVPWGLDSALVDPHTPHLIKQVRAIDFLTARDPYGTRYLAHYRSQTGGGDHP
jgi:5-methyltetrahydrofolate--homocysteine methyltransferase